MMKSYIIFLCVFLMTASVSFAQDKIIFLDSKEITNIKVIDVKDAVITYQETKDSKAVEKKVFTDKVFSVNYADGTENILYRPDTAMGDFSAEQMKLFIKGTKDAREKYHDYSSYFIGFAFGVTGPLIGSYTFPVLTPFPPAAGIFVAGLFSPNMNRQPVEKKYLNNIEYLQGYEKKARGKKTKHALYGALVGMVAGAFAFGLLP